MTDPPPPEARARLEEGFTPEMRKTLEAFVKIDPYKVPAFLDWSMNASRGLQQKIAALLSSHDAQAAELQRLRVRLFANRQVEGTSHSTACSIWGDDGQGGTAEGFAAPLPCNCGALTNFARQSQAAELSRLAARVGELEAEKAKREQAFEKWYGAPDPSTPQGERGGDDLNELIDALDAFIGAPNDFMSLTQEEARLCRALARDALEAAARRPGEEEIARIIDPEAWNDGRYGHPHWEPALTKARAILALFGDGK